MAAKKLKYDHICVPNFKYNKKIAASKDAMNPMDLSSHKRAKKALEFGVRMREPEFNIFVIGEDRTGRMSATRSFLEAHHRQLPPPPDWVYLNNFKRMHKPLPLQLNSGQGIVLKQYMKHFVLKLAKMIPETLESQELVGKIQQEQETLETQVEEKVQEIRTYALSKDLDLRNTDEGTTIVMAGEEDEKKDYDDLPEKEQKVIEEAYEKIRNNLHNVTQEAQKKNAALMETVESLRKEVIDDRISDLLERLKKKFSDVVGFRPWVNQLRSDILENLMLFEHYGKNPHEDDVLMHLHERYGVNLIVDHSDDLHPRVVLEPNPTYENLFGKIKYRASETGLETNFTMIRAGALHRANGGTLILRAEAIAQEPHVWDYLKSALRDQEIRTEELHRSNAMPLTDAPEPFAIPMDLQIVIVGAPRWFYGFFFQDPEFSTYFKVSADVDPDMPATTDNVNAYAQMITQAAQKCTGLDCDEDAIQALIGGSARWTGSRNKLSAQYEMVQDLLIESAAHAKKRNNKTIAKIDVKSAFRGRHERNAWLEERTQETIDEAIINIDVKGEVVGQVNGLTVLPMGFSSFGMPARVTARTYMGTEGVLNIERSTEMGGPIQQKGAMIVESFLKGIFGQTFPISFSGAITFEQNYGEIDGDSASLAEVCALLSSLADVPIRQDIAITGSMNQLGRAQAIGGAIEKIEGFYKTCEHHGLTKTQGVIVPQSNQPNIALRNKTAQSVKEGAFHIWTVETVEEAIELLTGMKAGKPTDRSKADTIYGRVFKNLKKFDHEMRRSHK